MPRIFPRLAMAVVLVFGTSLATRAEAAIDHATLAAAGTKVSNPKSGLPNLNTTKSHCRRLIPEYGEVANDAEALAKAHRAEAAAAK